MKISFSFVRNVLDDVSGDQARELNLLGGALFGCEVYANSHKVFTGTLPSFTIFCIFLLFVVAVFCRFSFYKRESLLHGS